MDVFILLLLLYIKRLLIIKNRSVHILVVVFRGFGGTSVKVFHWFPSPMFVSLMTDLSFVNAAVKPSYLFFLVVREPCASWIVVGCPALCTTKSDRATCLDHSLRGMCLNKRNAEFMSLLDVVLR